MSAIAVMGSAEAVTTLTGVGTPGDPFFVPGVSGVGQSTSLWNELGSGTVTGYGGYPGAAAWPAPIAAQSGDTTPGFNKTAGNSYVASASVYLAGTSLVPNMYGATFSVTEAAPLPGLATLVFQIQIGEAYGIDFRSGIPPLLSYTTVSGTVGDVSADFTSMFTQFQNGTMAGEPVFINTHAFQWDFSDVSEEVTAFSITFSGVQHAGVYGLRLDQGSAASGSLLPAAVPEPAAALLSVLGVFGLLRRRRA